MATKMSPTKAIRHFGVRLLQALPLDNVTFLNMVDEAGLLPLGNKAKIQAIPVNDDKVDHFKSKILEPGADIYLPKLLDVMDASGDPVAIALAKDIREATGLTKSNPKSAPKPKVKGGSVNASLTCSEVAQILKNDKYDELLHLSYLNMKNKLYQKGVITDNEKATIDKLTGTEQMEKVLGIIEHGLKTNTPMIYENFLLALEECGDTVSKEKAKELRKIAPVPK